MYILHMQCITKWKRPPLPSSSASTIRLARSTAGLFVGPPAPAPVHRVIYLIYLPFTLPCLTYAWWFTTISPSFPSIHPTLAVSSTPSSLIRISVVHLFETPNLDVKAL